VYFQFRVTLTVPQPLSLREVFSLTELYFRACMENFLKLPFSRPDDINMALAPMGSAPSTLFYFLTLYRLLILYRVETNQLGGVTMIRKCLHRMWEDEVA